MNTLAKLIGLLAALAFLAPALAVAADANAATPTAPAATTAPVKTAAMTRMASRATAEIDRRITNLNDLLARVGNIKNLSETDKASISTALTNQIDGLTQLRDKIAADTDETTLKADAQTVTVAYRIYVLVLPQVRIIAAADRIVSIALEFQQIAPKLESRILAAQSAGADMTAAASSYADFNAKVLDAQQGAQAAVSEISQLTPDNGDKVKMATNTTALKDARGKIVAAQQDLIAARKDASTIVAAVKGYPTTAPAPATDTSSSASTPTPTPTPTAGGQ